MGVTNISMKVLNSSSLKVSWNPPFSLKGVPILGYIIQLMNNNTQLNLSVENTYFNFTFKQRNEVLQMRLAAKNNAGVGEWTERQLTPPHSGRKMTVVSQL